MADLSKEWCERWAASYSSLNNPSGDMIKIAQALRIAARVLDEGFPQKLAELVMFNTGEITTADCMEAAQAVINYLLEGKK